MTNSYNLFLDDLREPHTVGIYMPSLSHLYHDLEWTIVRTYDEFVKTVEEMGAPAIVSFDHDLAHEHYINQEGPYTEKTGYDCALFLTAWCLNHGLPELPEWYCHSMNPVGKERIMSLGQVFQAKTQEP